MDANFNTAVAAPVAIDINELYRLNKKRLFRFVLHYVRNAEDAEDVVQSTYIEALRCADDFAGLSKPSTWLFGIALNLARNQMRRNGAHRYQTVDDAFMEQIADVNVDPAQLCEVRQTAGKVAATLGKLPVKLRTAFEAVADGESTYEEAAKQLCIPIGTVRSRVSRVRAVVRAECRD